MSIITVESGNSVVLRAEFTDYSGAAVDVTSPTFKIYDEEKTLVSTITENITRVGVGVYNYVYETTASTDPDSFYVEASGTIAGHPVLMRGRFTLVFDA